ncbi:S-layer homology domain-containing protein [Alkaliphilus transvaalensis]|uniref:S-layer homology domain-containing protein n=1 Tax=Alkaliphilus transvaalensis TaxID=114628 RepID=UPI000479C5EF|nr:S-layer homology domain-containing protein [Alkaliphilus transvaalensis]
MNKKAFMSLIIVIIFLLSGVSVVTGQSLHEVAEANGYTNGQILGEIAAQRDYINNQRSDWQKAHQEEEKKIIVLHDLTKETYTYRFYFLRGFKEGFKEGYERVYKELSNSKTLTDYDYGLSHGGFFGRMLGEINGVKEFHQGKTNDWKRTVPSDTDLTREYSLNRDTTRYRSGFIVGFKRAYEEGYTDAFRNANVDNHRFTKEMGLEHGSVVGKMQGEFFGEMDYVDGRSNDWKRAIPREQEVVIQANLLRENLQYREGFLAGYKEGFKEGYTVAFQNANITNTLQSIAHTNVSLVGATIITADDMLTLRIKPGSFYWDTYFTVDKEVRAIYQLNTNRLEAATNRYTIDVANHVGAVDLKEPIELEFTYYGSERAGIYQLINGEWRYLYSTISGSTITTVLPTGLYSGGTYAVFIDHQYPILRDIYTHWAYEEIYTFVRQFYVAGYTDGTFRPKEEVSRGEFVTLLNRVLKWNNISQPSINFIDEGQFGDHSTAIYNAVARGYIKGYPDNTFKSKNPITYQEIEWIMERILGSRGFKWADIEDKMLYEKYTRSDSRHSMGKHITRGEIIYMLHELQKEGKL